MCDLSGEVGHWSALAHRTLTELRDAGMRMRLETRAVSIDAPARRLTLRDTSGHDQDLAYDELIVGTGAVSVRPPIEGLGGPDVLGPGDGVHLLHSIGDARAVHDVLAECRPASAAIVGAGYIGLEMAEALTLRGIRVTQIEALAQVLPTGDPDLGALVRAQLEEHGVEVLTNTTVTRISRAGSGLRVEVGAAGAAGVARAVDLVLVVVGVRPDTALAQSAGARLGARRAIAVDRHMRTGVPHVFAAGDCAVTYPAARGELAAAGHDRAQAGRIAGQNALGGRRQFAGSLGTQVVEVFDLVAARTGLPRVRRQPRDTEPSKPSMPHGAGTCPFARTNRQPST